MKRSAGFTLVELLVGMSLSLLIMGAVLSSYVFLGRNFARSLGISSATEPNLEAQGRRTLGYFAQDVRMASGLVTSTSPYLSPSGNTVTLILPSSSGAKEIIYYFRSDDSDTNLPSFAIPTHSLIRIDLETNTSLVLHNNLLSCAFSYYDMSSKPYTIFDPATSGFSSLSGIKQISVEFTSQGGNKKNHTQTQIYSNASPRLILRNRQLLP